MSKVVVVTGPGLMSRLRERRARKLWSDTPSHGTIALQLASFEHWMAHTEWPVSELTVSVITATRDRPALLERAAVSLRRQDSTNWEWIVVNDGSAGACDSFAAADDRVVVIESDRRGLAAARNIGLEAASGHVVCYLDDDNELSSNWVRSLTFVVASMPDLTWGYGARVVETPEVDRSSDLPDFPFIEFPSFSIARLRRHNYIDANTVFHKRTGYRFDEATNSQSDWELVLQLATAAEPVRVPAISCVYRTRHAGRLSRSAARFDDSEHIRAKYQLRP